MRNVPRRADRDSAKAWRLTEEGVGKGLPMGREQGRKDNLRQHLFAPAWARRQSDGDTMTILSIRISIGREIGEARITSSNDGRVYGKGKLDYHNPRNIVNVMLSVQLQYLSSAHLALLLPSSLPVFNQAGSAYSALSSATRSISHSKIPNSFQLDGSVDVPACVFSLDGQHDSSVSEDYWNFRRRFQ